MKVSFPVLILIILCLGFKTQAQDKPVVALEKSGKGTLLKIKGQPFLILGGELGNSTASDMNYMRPYWDHLKKMNLNTVLAPVYWELMEPEEGKFNFDLVDSLINNARQHDLKLILLWFGTWKNSMSCYVPYWMKTNPKRFARTQNDQQASQEILSAFSTETLEADKKAFVALMSHLKKMDSDSATVIMVQVENEIGMLPTSREFSTVANKKFNEAIPAEFSGYLQKNSAQLVPELAARWKQNGAATKGSWETVFGKGLETDEIFQAWFYAKFANSVAEAGKKVYNLPMFVNAALPRAGKKPGEYPSAGPLPHILNIWQAAAPQIDVFSPDFYNPDTKYWCDLYNRNGNIVFIPEIRFDPTCAAKALYVIGHYKSLGFSPFSIESPNSGITPLTKSYDALNQLSPLILSQQWMAMDAFLFDKGKEAQELVMGKYKITANHEHTLPWSGGAKDSVWPVSGGIIIQTTEDEFLIAGSGVVFTFSSTDQNSVSNLASVDEVEFVNNKPIYGRRMNGDQDHQGRHVSFDMNNFGIQKVKLYRSPRKIE